MYYHLRRGRLEKGWSQILLGSALITSGYFFLTVEDLLLAYSSFYEIVDYIGTIICTLGLIVLMLGLRSHYSAWSLGRSQKAPVPIANNRENDRDKLVDLK
jgi:protein-S-isoprenylcysteine O-methyltransferase Ste14